MLLHDYMDYSWCKLSKGGNNKIRNKKKNKRGNDIFEIINHVIMISLLTPDMARLQGWLR